MHIRDVDWPPREYTTIVSSETDRGIASMYRVYSKDYSYVAEYEYPHTSDSLRIGVDSLRKARLVLGLFHEHKETTGAELYTKERLYSGDSSIPASVALAGKPCMAAYYKYIYDQSSLNTREIVAGMLDVSERTVSNYWDQIRWSGCVSCGQQNVNKIELEHNADDIHVVDCLDCGHYFVLPEDIKLIPHANPSMSSSSQPMEWTESCTKELQTVTLTHNGDEYQIECCETCGYYSSTSQKET